MLQYEKTALLADGVMFVLGYSAMEHGLKLRQLRKSLVGWIMRRRRVSCSFSGHEVALRGLRDGVRCRVALGAV